MVTIRVGTDCSGIEAPLHALQQLGVPYEHVFSSEICPAARKRLLANHSPQILYENVLTRDDDTAPYVYLYVAAWPCQGNSMLGKKEAWQTPAHGLSTTSYNTFTNNAQRSSCSRTWRTRCALTAVSSSMRSVRRWMTLATMRNGASYAPEDIGVPIGRRRLYIVAVRADLRFSVFLANATCASHSSS